MTEDLMEWAGTADVVYLAGLLAGVFLFVCVGIRGVAKGFGLGEGGAALVGLLAMGMSVWSHVKVQFSPEGWEAELTRRLEQVEEKAEKVAESIPRIAREVDAVASATRAVTDQIPVLARNIEYTQELARAVERDAAAPSRDARPSRPQVRPPEEINLEQIRDAKRLLQMREADRRVLMDELFSPGAGDAREGRSP